MTSAAHDAPSTLHATTPPPHPPPPPPPLPPRFSASTYSPRPDPSLKAMSSHDPRSSSTQSLVPDPSTDHAGRRTLLIIYIHGFMGDETSFQSFPAHVHNLVTITLADTHVVHTKIYPKYRSRYALEVARDDFSNWLAPHESPTTDVVLLGHSMGGLLCADITLLFRHNIIGTINFDVPFLGMHPGIVKAGLQSIFKPWPGPETQSAPQSELNGSSSKKPSRIDTLFNPKPTDPNYNPSFANDVHLPIRKGWENTLHFINKHSNNLMKASKGLVASHLQFGGTMADYRGLKERYARIRGLEEDDENKRKTAVPEAPIVPRIRFVNYYTASTGRPKKPKPQSPSRSDHQKSESIDDRIQGTASTSTLNLPAKESTSRTASPRVSVEEHRDNNEVVPVTPEEPISATSPLQQSLPEKESRDDDTAPDLPEIPSVPEEPAIVDFSQYTDKTVRRAAEKEHEHFVKEYEKAVKHRNSVIKQREKMEEKWKKQKEKEERKKQKQKPSTNNEAVERKSNEEDGDESGRLSIEEDMRGLQLGVIKPNGNSPYSNYDFSRTGILNTASPDDRSSITESCAPSESTNLSPTSSHTTASHPTTESHDSDKPPKKKRYKKFCMLPPKDRYGNKDPTWIRVFMKDVDEVGAHCGLFFVSETYEMLVGDVGGRIEEWVREGETLRLVRELS